MVRTSPAVVVVVLALIVLVGCAAESRRLGGDGAANGDTSSWNRRQLEADAEIDAQERQIRRQRADIDALQDRQSYESDRRDGLTDEGDDEDDDEPWSGDSC